MNIQEVKETAEKYISNAKGLLVLEKSFNPALLAISEEGKITAVSLIIENNKDKDSITELMIEMAGTCEALILIMDSHIVEVDKDKIDEVPDDITKDPRVEQALICIAHTKDASAMRQFRYHSDNGEYGFFDLGWRGMDDSSGRFKNPFKKK